MAQTDSVISDQNGAAFLADLNNLIQALLTQHSGTADPAPLVALQRFARTDLGVIKRRNAANSANILDDTLAETLVVEKSATFTAGLADFKRTFICTGTWTLNLASASTLGDGWWCFLRNNGTGIITLDPAAAETINGSTAIKVQAGRSCIITTNGVSLYSIGMDDQPTQGSSFITAAVDVTYYNTSTKLLILYFSITGGTGGFGVFVSGTTGGDSPYVIHKSGTISGNTWATVVVPAGCSWGWTAHAGTTTCTVSKLN